MQIRCFKNSKLTRKKFMNLKNVDLIHSSYWITVGEYSIK